MILPFKTTFKDGSPTEFVGKIWAGLIPIKGNDAAEAMAKFRMGISKGLVQYAPTVGECLKHYVPKLHTMRQDEKNRWKPGMKIHAVVFNRTKKRFQFVPVMECKAVQDIEIVYGDHRVEVFIDCEYYDGVSMRDDTEHEELETLARNDGFKDKSGFFNYFKKGFTGKIIHWTDLKY